MATIDQQFVEYIVKTLVNNPDKVKVERRIDEKGVLLSLTVDPEDVGRVIGRHGVTAQAMRVLLRALGTKQDARYNLKIENGAGAERGGETYYAEEDTTTTSDGEIDTEEAVAVEEDVSDTEGGATDDEVVEEESATSDEGEGETSELAEKTRQELADLDDLDI